MREYRAQAMSLQPAVRALGEGFRGSERPHSESGSASLAERPESSPEDDAKAEVPHRQPSRLRVISAIGSEEPCQHGSEAKGMEEFIGAARQMIAMHGAQAIYVAQHAATFARDGGHLLEMEQWDGVVAAIRAIASAELGDAEPTLDGGRGGGV
jgi:hypothetical protein